MTVDIMPPNNLKKQPMKTIKTTGKPAHRG